MDTVQTTGAVHTHTARYPDTGTQPRTCRLPSGCRRSHAPCGSSRSSSPRTTTPRQSLICVMGREGRRHGEEWQGGRPAAGVVTLRPRVTCPTRGCPTAAPRPRPAAGPCLCPASTPHTHTRATPQINLRRPSGLHPPPRLAGVRQVALLDAGAQRAVVQLPPQHRRLGRRRQLLACQAGSHHLVCNWRGRGRTYRGRIAGWPGGGQLVGPGCDTRATWQPGRGAHRIRFRLCTHLLPG